MITKQELNEVLEQVNAIFKQYGDRISALEEAAKKQTPKRTPSK